MWRRAEVPGTPISRLRVQRETGQAIPRAEGAVERALAVRGVAEHGMADVFEVPPRLVLAPGEQLHFHQRATLHRGVEQGAHDAVRVGRSTVIVDDRMVDGVLGAHVAAHQRPVTLARTSERESRLPSSDVRLGGKQQRAARASVEAVHGMQLRSELGAHEGDHGHALGRSRKRGVVHEQPGRLVHGHAASAVPEQVHGVG